MPKPFICIPLFVFSFFSYGQCLENSVWYLLGEKEYKVFTFYKDSIVISATNGFDIFNKKPNTQKDNIPIYEVKENKNNCFYFIAGNDIDFLFVTQLQNPNHAKFMMVEKLEDAIQNFDINPVFELGNLVSQEEVDKYKYLKDFKSISHEDLVAALEFIFAIKKENYYKDKSNMHSEIKMMFAELGYNPEFTLNEFQDFVEQSDNLEIKKLLNYYNSNL